MHSLSPSAAIDIPPGLHGEYVPCFLAYSILFSLISSVYALLNLSVSRTVTMTTGGVPKGIPSPQPNTRDRRNREKPNMHANISIVFTRLLRSVGNLEDRSAYGLGFEVFLEGRARCIVDCEGLSAPREASSEAEPNGGSDLERFRNQSSCWRGE